MPEAIRVAGSHASPIQPDTRLSTMSIVQKAAMGLFNTLVDLGLPTGAQGLEEGDRTHAEALQESVVFQNALGLVLQKPNLIVRGGSSPGQECFGR